MEGLNPGPSQALQKQQLTQQQIEQMHDLAAALQKNALDTQPIYSPWAGAARMADALAGNITQAAQANAQRQQLKSGADFEKGLGGFFNPSGEAAASPGGDMDNYVNRTIEIESGGDPNAHTGSNRGLGQFGPEEERRYGINDQNRSDPEVQKNALRQEANENAAALTAAGLPVSDSNLYLLHQQGRGGGIALLQNPDKPAGQVLGHFYGDGGAKAISGNTYKDAPFHGQDPTSVKAGDFVGYWAHKFNPITPAGAAEASTSVNPSPNERVSADMAALPSVSSPTTPQTTYLGNPAGPQTPMPMPRPASMGPGAPAAPPAPPMPQPRPPGMGPSAGQMPAAQPQPQPQAAPPTFIPGSIPPDKVPQFRAMIYEALGNPYTHDRAAQWLEKIKPTEHKDEQGRTVVGDPITGWHITGQTGLYETKEMNLPGHLGTVTLRPKGAVGAVPVGTPEEPPNKVPEGQPQFDPKSGKYIQHPHDPITRFFMDLFGTPHT